MTCAEYKELAAAYALGALEPDERDAFRRHLGEPRHEGCAEALAQARLAAEAIAASLDPVQPPPDMWSRIEAGLGEERRATASPERGRSRVVGWLLAAAMLLVILWLGWSRRQVQGSLEQAEKERGAAAEKLAQADTVRARCESDLKQAERELVERTEAVALLGLPSTKLVQLGPQVPAPGPRAVAIVNLDQKRGVLVADGLARKADGDYELWVIKGSEKKAAGLLRGTDGRPLYARIDPALLAGGADALAVTFEPPGGGSSPRGPIVILGALPKT